MGGCEGWHRRNWGVVLQIFKWRKRLTQWKVSIECVDLKALMYPSSIALSQTQNMSKVTEDNRHIRSGDRTKKLVGIMFVPEYLF